MLELQASSSPPPPTTAALAPAARSTPRRLQNSWPLGVPLRGPLCPPQRLRAIRLRSLVTHCHRSPLRVAPSARDRI